MSDRTEMNAWRYNIYAATKTSVSTRQVSLERSFKIGNCVRLFKVILFS